MKTIVYVGSADEVEVPAAGIFAKKGEPVEVEDDVAKSLLKQESNWAAGKAKPSKKE